MVLLLAHDGVANARIANQLQPFVWKASAGVILDKVRNRKELTRTGE